MDDAPTPITKHATTVCNAQLHRGGGYCQNGAGQGTDHIGRGRCKLHGGDLGVMPEHTADDLFRRAGLDFIIDLAESMTHGDQEYLMDVGNNAMVVTRSKILARIQGEALTPRELNDLTNSLTRIDNLIAKHPNAVAEAEAKAEAGDAEELARVRELYGG